MKLVDTNILIYAVNRRAVHHDRVRKWLEEALVGDEPVGFAWIVVLGFLRLATKPGVFENPLSPDNAIALVEDWFTQPNATIVVESDSHWQLLREALRETGTAGNLTNDAHLAALASSIGATVVSCDTDFGRFRHVRWENPLDS